MALADSSGSYYGTTYFSTAYGSALPSAFTLQIITNVVNVVTTFPGLWAIDALGRRTVLLTGALGMGISQYLVSSMFRREQMGNAFVLTMYQFWV